VYAVREGPLSFGPSIRPTRLFARSLKPMRWAHNSHAIQVPAVWSQLHICQVSCLHLQRLQRYHANEILVTQQNKQTYKHLPKYSHSLMSPEPLFVLPPHQSGGRRHYVLNLSVRSFVRSSVRPCIRPFVCYQTFDHDILKQNKPILIPIGTSGSRGKGMK